METDEENEKFEFGICKYGVGGFQAILDCFAMLQFRNLKYKGQLAKSVTVILEAGQFPLHHQAKRRVHRSKSWAESNLIPLKTVSFLNNQQDHKKENRLRFHTAACSVGGIE
ncbi:hypothetical protein V6N12_045339 [Hibiscus sabdariffa]|uniref:Uncharacterized protein n=1 Tax=Hibiscus sabdariffa TaxID=183260 RepID=A0ABR2G2H8_9ROSI